MNLQLNLPAAPCCPPLLASLPRVGKKGLKKCAPPTNGSGKSHAGYFPLACAKTREILDKFGLSGLRLLESTFHPGKSELSDAKNFGGSSPENTLWCFRVDRPEFLGKYACCKCEDAILLSSREKSRVEVALAARSAFSRLRRASIIELGVSCRNSVTHAPNRALGP